MMARARRHTAEQALRLILQASEELRDEDNSLENEYEAPYDADEEQSCDQGVSVGEEVTESGDEGDIPIESESDDEDSSDESDSYICEARGVSYTSRPFEQHRRIRNIISSRTARNLAHPRTDAEAFNLFFREEIVRTIQTYTNRKVNDIRRQVSRVRDY